LLMHNDEKFLPFLADGHGFVVCSNATNTWFVLPAI
jgi:hypothetical protein